MFNSAVFKVMQSRNSAASPNLIDLRVGSEFISFLSKRMNVVCASSRLRGQVAVRVLKANARFVVTGRPRSDGAREDPG